MCPFQSIGGPIYSQAEWNLPCYFCLSMATAGLRSQSPVCPPLNYVTGTITLNGITTAQFSTTGQQTVRAALAQIANGPHLETGLCGSPHGGRNCDLNDIIISNIASSSRAGVSMKYDFLAANKDGATAIMQAIGLSMTATGGSSFLSVLKAKAVSYGWSNGATITSATATESTASQQTASSSSSSSLSIGAIIGIVIACVVCCGGTIAVIFVLMKPRTAADQSRGTETEVHTANIPPTMGSEHGAELDKADGAHQI